MSKIKAAAGFKKPQEKTETPFVKPVDQTKDVRTKPGRNRLDALTQHLNADGFFMRMRWPWFVFEWGGRNHALEVSRWYPGNKIAIDIAERDQNMIKIKKNLLEANGIQYFVLDFETDFGKLERREAHHEL